MQTLVDYDVGIEFINWATANSLARRAQPGWTRPDWPDELKPLASWARHLVMNDTAHFGNLSIDEFRRFEDRSADLIFQRQCMVMYSAVIKSTNHKLKQMGIDNPTSKRSVPINLARVLEGIGRMVQTDPHLTPASERAIGRLRTKTTKAGDEVIFCPICQGTVEAGEAIAILECHDSHIVCYHEVRYCHETHTDCKLFSFTKVAWPHIFGL